jgi:glucose-6-phosphate isomerase
LRSDPGRSFTVEEVAAAVKAEEQVESVFKVLEHASMNEDHRVKRIAGKTVFDARYQGSE